MNIVTLLPFIVLIGAMFLMTRSAKKKQQKATQMRDQMQPGTGVRTIGGMYATVKEIRDDAVLLEVAPGTHALYAKNAIGAVLEPDEFDSIIHGEPIDLTSDDAPIVPDDVSELTSDDEADKDGKIDLGKSTADDERHTSDEADEDETEDETDAADLKKTDADPKKSDADAEDETDGDEDDEAAEPRDAKRDGGSGKK